MDDADISKIVSGLLRRTLKPHGFLRSEAQTEEDFDGSSIIRVRAYFGEQPPPEKLVDALHGIRAELVSRGENRFVLLDSAYRNNEIIDEEVE